MRWGAVEEALEVLDVGVPVGEGGCEAVAGEVQAEGEVAVGEGEG